MVMVLSRENNFKKHLNVINIDLWNIREWDDNDEWEVAGWGDYELW